MSHHGHFGPKPEPEQSEKAHTDHPPKDLAPHDKPPEDSRGQTGQFTDRGSPGVRKK